MTLNPTAPANRPAPTAEQIATVNDAIAAHRYLCGVVEFERAHYAANDIGFKFLQLAMAKKTAALKEVFKACEQAGVCAKGYMYSTATFAAKGVIVGLSNARINAAGRWEYEIASADLGIAETVDERALERFVL